MEQKKVGLFPMCADILHAGHIMALQEAKEHCDILVVALNASPDGKEPVQTAFERYIQLSAVKYIDELIIYHGRAYLEAIASAYQYDIRFLGSDYKDKEWDGKEQEKARGIQPYFIERWHNFSSTELKNRIIERGSKNA